MIPFVFLISMSSSFHAPSPSELYTLSLHDALPIFPSTPFAVDAWAGINPPASQEKISIKTPTAVEEVTPVKERERPSDRKSTRLNSSHRCISYAVFCLKKKKKNIKKITTHTNKIQK